MSVEEERPRRDAKPGVLQKGDASLNSEYPCRNLRVALKRPTSSALPPSLPAPRPVLPPLNPHQSLLSPFFPYPPCLSPLPLPSCLRTTPGRRSSPRRPVRAVASLPPIGCLVAAYRRPPSSRPPSCPARLQVYLHLYQIMRVSSLRKAAGIKYPQGACRREASVDRAHEPTTSR